MTVEEIFKSLSAHMIKGVMTHEELADYYDFLGLKGYKRCHEYHAMSEMCGYRQLCRYYINHYSKLIPFIKIDQPEVIPDSWYSHVREDVDPSTKKNAVKNGLSAWLDWEKSTKDLYQQMYKELLDLGEVASANLIMTFVEDVDCELKKVERYMLNKMSTGFDMVGIMEEQSRKHDKYKKKMEKELRVHIC